MKLIDSHVHLNFKEFREDMEQVIDRSQQNNVAIMVNIGVDLKTSEESINLAERYQNIYATVGVHPHSASEFSDIQSKIKQLASHNKVVAVGEIGLDYFRNLSAHEDQISAFKEQLGIALHLKKPVVLHCRDAYTEVIQILKSDYISNLSGRLPGVVHSFTAGSAFAKEFLEMGFYIGLNNIITYPRSTSLIEAIKNIPLNRIVLETDCPYLPPQQIRGERCEPMHVNEVAKKLAEIKGLSIKEVVEQTTINTTQVFGL